MQLWVLSVALIMTGQTTIQAQILGGPPIRPVNDTSEASNPSTVVALPFPVLQNASNPSPPTVQAYASCINGMLLAAQNLGFINESDRRAFSDHSDNDSWDQAAKSQCLVIANVFPDNSGTDANNSTNPANVASSGRVIH